MPILNADRARAAIDKTVLPTDPEVNAEMLANVTERMMKLAEANVLEAVDYDNSSTTLKLSDGLFKKNSYSPTDVFTQIATKVRVKKQLEKKGYTVTVHEHTDGPTLVLKW